MSQMFNPIRQAGRYRQAMNAATEETADLLRTVLADLAPLLGRIEAGQLHAPTPCAQMDVEQLRDHVLGWLQVFADGYADPDGQADPDLSGFRPPADVEAAARAAADTLDGALRSGAADRPLTLGGSAMPGALALSMILWEYQVHGWDLARATGQPWSPPAQASLQSLEFAPQMLTAEYQGEGKAFGPRVSVPADAPPLDRLLGLSGRHPDWQPGDQPARVG
jgi:uncharacterized protein (TIGR03086 family)